jgi:hypothetical protein
MEKEKKELKIDKLYLYFYNGVGKFKSIRRAIRRGNVSITGEIYPRRPFNNRKDKQLENKKRIIFENIKKLKNGTRTN